MIEGRFDPSDISVVVKLSTHAWTRLDDMVYQRQLRILKRKSAKDAVRMFLDDCGECDDWSKMVNIKDCPDGEYKVYLIPVAYASELSDILEEWHYELRSYTEEEAPS